MNNPEVIRFVNEQVRVMAERLRGLKAECDAMDARWQSSIGTVVSANLAEAVEDGREADGVSRLTCNDVVLLMAQVEAFIAQLNGAGVGAVIAKPCVNPLRVS